MSKFYIKFGNRQYIQVGLDIMEACNKVIKEYLKDNSTVHLPTFFKVSEQGWDEHDDDITVDVDELILHQYNLNNPGDPLL